LLKGESRTTLAECARIHAYDFFCIIDTLTSASVLPGIEVIIDGYPSRVAFTGHDHIDNMSSYSRFRVPRWQQGVVFASAQTIATNRTLLESFMRAYQRGTAEYALNFLSYDDGGDTQTSTWSISRSKCGFGKTAAASTKASWLPTFWIFHSSARILRLLLGLLMNYVTNRPTTAFHVSLPLLRMRYCRFVEVK
jgi:hypothetical protein